VEGTDINKTRINVKCVHAIRDDQKQLQKKHEKEKKKTKKTERKKKITRE
jgi:hypothetical protein